MGRAKLNMDLISKEKSRNITFKKRKETLIRKMHEFTTLCDVRACMIIYGPKQEEGGLQAEPEIWPENLEEIHRIIDIYKTKKKEWGNKTFELSDFFYDRKRKIEEELCKLRKMNMEAKCPTWIELLNFMTESQLREFAAALGNKVEYVRSRIEILRRNKQAQGLNNNINMDIAHVMNNNDLMMDFGRGHASAGLLHHHHQSQSQNFLSPPPPPPMRGPSIELEAVINHEMHVPVITNIDHHHHQELHSVNQNSMMMLLVNDNDHCVQFGGASTSANIDRDSFKRQVFYESSYTSPGLGDVDPMICHNPRLLARYYAPPVAPPPPPPYMMPGPPQLQFSTNDGSQQEDVVQYQMKNHGGARCQE